MAKYFKKVSSFENLKEQYKHLIKGNHPDNGGELEKMQEINAEYDALFKIWKDRHESETGEKVTETAESTRRHFYTAFGWEGSRYDPKLTLKEIAVRVRAYVKEKYPTCKFSVRTSYASMCQELHVEIKEFPAQMYKTADDLGKEGLHEHVVTTMSFGERKGERYEYDRYTEEISDMERKLRRNSYFNLDSWTDEDLIKAYGEACKVSNFYAIKTEYFSSVLADVDAFVKSYNYDDCDGMQDYFDVNFYYFGCKFENCKQVEKVARVADKQDKAPATTAQPGKVGAIDEKTAESDTEGAQTAEEITAEPNGDMFAELAKAFITGKQAKKPQEEPKPEEAPQEKKNEEEPQPYVIGYHGEASDILTAEEVHTLTDGERVHKGEKWTERTYIATPYTTGAYLAYTIQGETVEPGHDAKYAGFIANGLYYQDTDAIREKLAEDINKELLNRIPDEDTAKALFDTLDAESWERRDIDKYIEYDRTGTVKELFYKDEKPQIRLYGQGRDISTADMIKYILEPEKTITDFATAYTESHKADIYKRWIDYTRTAAKYAEIVADKDNEAHTLKRISKAIDNQKTVKILLTNGAEVRAEAHAVKHITCGYISDWYVQACDRQHIDKDECGRAKNITADDIVQITHGGRVLYRAS